MTKEGQGEIVVRFEGCIAIVNGIKPDLGKLVEGKGRVKI
jgi:hypothetical protein